MEQHVRGEAAFEGEAPPTLKALEGLLGVGPVHRLMGLQLEPLAEGLVAVLTAQGLLARARAVPPGPPPTGLGPHYPCRPPLDVHRVPFLLCLCLGHPSQSFSVIQRNSNEQVEVEHPAQGCLLQTFHIAYSPTTTRLEAGSESF